MQYDIVHPGSNAMVVVQLANQEFVKCNAGTMVAMSHNIVIEAKADGGIGKALKRAVLGGEGFFFETLRAQDGPGEVMVAPAIPGDIKVLDLTQGQDYFLQGGTFVAALGEITIDTRMQKLSQGLFSGEGLFVLHVHGRGHVVASAFGGVYEVTIPAGRDYIIDNGHLVAWSGDTNYTIEKAAKGLWNTMTSGEGLVCRFKGPGKVWIQTRNPHEFGAWIRQFVPASSAE